jgi:hypothetical protein
MQLAYDCFMQHEKSCSLLKHVLKPYDNIGQIIPNLAIFAQKKRVGSFARAVGGYKARATANQIVRNMSVIL